MQLRKRPWLVAASGTRYVRAKAPPPPPPKAKEPPPSAHLLPFLTGEAEGDFTLAAILALRNLLRDSRCYDPSCRAQTASGLGTEPTSSDAVRWNLFGGLEYVTYPLPQEQRREILHYIKKFLPREAQDIPLFRWLEEDAQHIQVINVLNRAIGQRKKDLGE